MSEFLNIRRWGDLIPEALGLIFRKLPLQEKLSVVPRVCKSWNRVVSGPFCWLEIDILEWSRTAQPEQIERMLRLLLPRSSGSCQRIAVSGIDDNSVLFFIADYASALQSLEIPRAFITDAGVVQIANKFSRINVLDISFCSMIGSPALEAFGLHCKNLRGLRRTTRPEEFFGKVCEDDEALSIALTMPKLRYLELAYRRLTTPGLLQILSSCPDLQFLDISGCWYVELGEKMLKKYPGLRVRGPGIFVYLSDYTDNSSDTSEQLECIENDGMHDDTLSDEETVVKGGRR